LGGLVARANRIGEPELYGLRLSHDGAVEQTRYEQRKQGERVILNVAPPAWVVRRRDRREEVGHAAERGDGGRLPMPARRQVQDHCVSVAVADSRVGPAL